LTHKKTNAWYSNWVSVSVSGAWLWRRCSPVVEYDAYIFTRISYS